ncbi:Rho-binding antiterminator [Providencia rustigianii]|uniref:Modulator of Rho-dependent transcription termination (ROF) n=2 Tax=Providencia rustigianii TaxID=158850 RepID=D1P1A9_9GAMM|nr:MULTISPECIES: Rho-binding antiterminator [Providencia]EFB72695.1 modulator of Rho-dependent transcription termination (ROF) [Providencia rustigianii DSM 4541]MTC56733.1 Rho-binding antiterminator [Providencia rustigianii]MTC58987.1 Rho-binding antiterminator [Providencia rustigianii]SPY78612.1 Rho-binding antiterminator [Providencia rustigianii]SUC28261.1 Rho-binding antiterminator [Providencia rustigianii]
MSTDNEYQPINCDDYEYLEIACQRQLKLQVQLNDGENIEGQASDLLLRKKIEYLVLITQEGTKELRLDYINSFSHPEIGTIVVDQSH